jgi:hypothetical protein
MKNISLSVCVSEYKLSFVENLTQDSSNLESKTVQKSLSMAPLLEKSANYFLLTNNKLKKFSLIVGYLIYSIVSFVYSYCIL